MFPSTRLSLVWSHAFFMFAWQSAIISATVSESHLKRFVLHVGTSVAILMFSVATPRLSCSTVSFTAHLPYAFLTNALSLVIIPASIG